MSSESCSPVFLAHPVQEVWEAFWVKNGRPWMQTEESLPQASCHSYAQGIQPLGSSGNSRPAISVPAGFRKQPLSFGRFPKKHTIFSCLLSSPLATVMGKTKSSEIAWNTLCLEGPWKGGGVVSWLWNSCWRPRRKEMKDASSACWTIQEFQSRPKAGMDLDSGV